MLLSKFFIEKKQTNIPHFGVKKDNKLYFKNFRKVDEEVKMLSMKIIVYLLLSCDPAKNCSEQ